MRHTADDEKGAAAMSAVNMNRKMYDEALRGDRPVLVDFWAPWCTYCRKIADAYDRIAQKYGDKILVAKINVDNEEAMMQELGIELIPTLILYQQGEEKGRIVAPESGAVIEQFIGDTLSAPAQEEDTHVYDMAVIGGGPGGYTAALYAARAGMDVVVLEKLSAGGQMALTHQIDNYPGFVEGVGGFELGEQMKAQAERFGAKSHYTQVNRVDMEAQPKVIHTSEGVLRAKTVVLATGANPRELGVPEEKEMLGRGVAYCAACDGMFYKGKTVAVVGGGNSAAADALLLSRVASKVILIHRRDTLRATKVYHDPLLQADNVKMRWNSVVTELLHGEKLTGLRLKNVLTGEETEISCDGVFVSVGRKPATELAAGQLALDESGYIIADESTRTNIPGVYAVGDVRTKALRQVVTAVADGAVAVHMAEEFLAAGH